MPFRSTSQRLPSSIGASADALRVATTLGWQLLGAVVAIGGAVACIAAVVAVDDRYRSLGQPPFVDWLTYANAFDRLLRGEPLYAATQLSGPYLLPRSVTIGYSYPPASVVLFAPFSSGWLGLLSWLLLNAVILWSAVTALVCRAFRLPIVWAAAVTAVTLSAFVPLSTGLATGNVNVALAGLAGWVWIGSDRRWVAAVAGLAGLVKIYPGFLVLWAARWEAWRALSRAGIVVLGLSLLTLPVVGIESWRDYAVALHNAQPTCWPGTASVACALAPVFGMATGKVAGIAIGIGLVLLGWRIRNAFAAYFVLVVGMLAPVTDGWIHYGLFAYVLMLIGFDHAARQRRRRNT